MEKNKIKSNPMGYENEFNLLIRMSVPAMISMLTQALYNIVDSFFVAKLGEKALRALSITFPLQLFQIALAVGTGVGINSFISRSFGAKKEEEGNNGAMHGYFLIGITYVIMAVLSHFYLYDFLSLFTSDMEVLDYAYTYMSTLTYFVFFKYFQITSEKIIQSTGNMMIPMASHLTAAFINLILDPIFIFGLGPVPAMGIKGAAIATILGEMVGSIIATSYVLSNKTDITIKLRQFKFNWAITKDIYKVALPNILMQSIGSILISLLNSILAASNEFAVTILGVINKLQSFVFMPIYGLTHGFLPIVAYNYGAKNNDRINNTYKYASLVAIAISFVGVALFQIFPDKLIGIFIKEENIIRMGVTALRIVSVSYLFASVAIINSTYFGALAEGKYSLYMSLLRQLVLILPVAYIFGRENINFVWIAYPVAEIITLIISNRTKKSMDRRLLV